MSEPPTLNRRILAIAVPALGSLIAEPLYLLVDSVIVGHLGPAELAGLGIATQVLLTVVSLCVFLAYGTTTEVAGTDSPKRRAELGVHGLWLGAATGAFVVIALLAFAGPITELTGHGNDARELGERYLRIAALGVGAQLVAIAGQGWLRGREQLRLALRLVVAGQIINVVAEVVLVYGFGLGLDGSAIGTVIAQVSMAAATIVLVVRAARESGATLAPHASTLVHLSRFGGLLIVRSAALSGSYLLVAAYVARISVPATGAHHVATQLLWASASRAPTTSPRSCCGPARSPSTR